MGILFSPAKWTLVSADAKSPTLEGQFEAQNLVENISGAWAQHATLGLTQPILQFLGGELETITLDVKVFARFDPIFKSLKGPLSLADEDFDVGDLVEVIRNLPRANPDLGRPEVWIFAIGEQFTQRVIVKSVGGIRYDRFRPMKPLGAGGGEIRGVLCSFELWRYEPYSVSTLTGAAESLVTPTKEGETYEHVAGRVHGDPLLGESLRRRNPDRRTLVAGDLVHVPEARILRRESLPLTPQSLFLRTGEAQRALLVDAIDIHGGTTPSHVVLGDF